MHQEAELGIAAHWVYQQQKGLRGYFHLKSARPKLEDVEWVRQLRSWLSTRSSLETKPEEFIESMKIDFFRDRIFVITPRGDVLDLPAGSTPVDFAYHIHSEIGNACVGAKVNGTFVPLDEELHSGDVVEIVIQKNKKPSEDWLKFVKTSVAKSHIRNALKEKDRVLRKRMPTKTELRLVVKDRIGLLKDITSVIASLRLSILNLHTTASAGSDFPIDKIEIATTDKRKVEKLVLKLKKIKEIKEISYKVL
jgi:GTP pyrophosphokinase